MKVSALKSLAFSATKHHHLSQNRFILLTAAMLQEPFQHRAAERVSEDVLERLAF